MQDSTFPITPVSGASLTGTRLLLREISLDDVTDKYVSWLNNPEINQYLESRFSVSTLDSVRQFVLSKIGKSNCQMFAILTKERREHIGNIKIDPIYWVHRRAEIGLLIGELEHTGKGYATEAITLLKDYAFQTLKLHKLTAGCYCPNVGSVKAFEKAGFTIEATIKRHSIYKTDYVDCFLLAAINE